MRDCEGRRLERGDLVLAPHPDPNKRRQYVLGPVRLPSNLVERAAVTLALQQKTGFKVSEIVETTEGYTPAAYLRLVPEAGLKSNGTRFKSLIDSLRA